MPGVRAMSRQLVALSNEMDINALSAAFCAGNEPLSMAVEKRKQSLLFVMKIHGGTRLQNA